MERQILCPVGTIKAGMYILYHNNYWLITGRPDNNKSYEKSTLDICQYKLRWQNSNGEIIDRWCNMTSSSKYGQGESGNSTIIVTDDSLTLLLPNDGESLLLGDREESNQRRVFIDKQVIPKKVYKITREDDVLYDYGEAGGILSFIAKKTELNKETDNQELRICDYITPTAPSQPTTPDSGDGNLDKSPILSCSLKFSGNTEFRVGGNYKTIKGVISDELGNITDDVGVFDLITIDELKPYIIYTVSDNTLKVKVSEEDSAIGGIVRIQFTTTDGKYSTYADFNIVNNY